MKKVLFSFLIIILAFSIIGCSKNDLKAYNSARLKTSNIRKGQKSFEMKIDNELCEDGLTDKELKELNNFKSMNMNSYISYDLNMKKAMGINYTQLGGLGLDSIIYMDGDDQYLQLSTYWKYLILNEDVDTDNPIEKSTVDRIKSKWIEILNEEDVFSGEKILLSTEDGEVKAREYTIKLNEEQLKEFLNFVLDVLEEDTKFNEFSKQMVIGIGEELADKDKEDIIGSLIKDLRISIEDSKDLSFKYKSFIDIDDYIVEENIDFILNKETKKKGDLEKISANIVVKNWDIEKDQDLEFPEITLENSSRIEDVDWENIFR